MLMARQYDTFWLLTCANSFLHFPNTVVVEVEKGKIKQVKEVPQVVLDGKVVIYNNETGGTGY
jgi:hypothetical protein